MRKESLLLLLSLIATSCVIRPEQQASESTEPQPIRTSAHDPRYLEYEEEPVILITSAEHYGAVLNRDFDYERYLETLHRDGLNYTRIFSGSYVEREGSFGIENNTLAPARGSLLAPWARSEEPGYVNGGNKFDLERWDPVYFRRLEDFLEKAAQREIIVELTFFSSIYNDSHWEYSPLHPSNNVSGLKEIDYRKVNTLENGPLRDIQEKMVRKIVRELNEHNNLFYEIQNEPYADRPVTALPINSFLPDWKENWRNRVDLADSASLEWQEWIAECIRSEEESLPKKHLIAQNYSNFRYPIEEVGEAISILNFHYAFPEAVAWNYGRRKVVSFDESGFSGQEPDAYRRQAWRFILAGGGIFNNLDYSFYPGAEDGSGRNNAPGGGGAELRGQLRVLREFIDGFDVLRMGPDRSLVRVSPGATWQALATRGQAYAIYIEGEGPLELSLSIWGGPYRAEWIDTRTGQVAKIEEFAPDWRAVLKSPPFESDIALKITRSE